MGVSTGHEMERCRGVLCAAEEPAQMHLALTVGRRLPASLGSDYRFTSSRGQCRLVWGANLGGSGLQGCETRRMGVASQQNAGCLPSRTHLARNGGSDGVDGECGKSSRSPTFVCFSDAYGTDSVPPGTTSVAYALSSSFKLFATRTTPALSCSAER